MFNQLYLIKISYIEDLFLVRAFSTFLCTSMQGFDQAVMVASRAASGG
jgi:hypothetical protein